jgi:hypothetical protein
MVKVVPLVVPANGPLEMTPENGPLMFEVKVPTAVTVKICPFAVAANASRPDMTKRRANRIGAVVGHQPAKASRKEARHP